MHISTSSDVAFGRQLVNYDICDVIESMPAALRTRACSRFRAGPDGTIHPIGLEEAAEIWNLFRPRPAYQAFA
jgi:hypothetical protein